MTWDWYDNENVEKFIFGRKPNLDKKRQELDRQLANGQITQEIYNQGIREIQNLQAQQSSQSPNLPQPQATQNQTGMPMPKVKQMQNQPLLVPKKPRPQPTRTPKKPKQNFLGRVKNKLTGSPNTTNQTQTSTPQQTPTQTTVPQIPLPASENIPLPEKGSSNNPATKRKLTPEEINRRRTELIQNNKAGTWKKIIQR